MPAATSVRLLHSSSSTLVSKAPLNSLNLLRALRDGAGWLRLVHFRSGARVLLTCAGYVLVWCAVCVVYYVLSTVLGAFLLHRWRSGKSDEERRALRSAYNGMYDDMYTDIFEADNMRHLTFFTIMEPELEEIYVRILRGEDIPPDGNLIFTADKFPSHALRFFYAHRLLNQVARRHAFQTLPSSASELELVMHMLQMRLMYMEAIKILSIRRSLALIEVRSVWLEPRWGEVEEDDIGEEEASEPETKGERTWW
jgi:hypothetical protein